MSRRKIRAAAKRKGLTVVSAVWGWSAGDYESYQQWEIQFGPEIDQLFAEDEFQYFVDTTDALEFIDSLDRLGPAKALVESWELRSREALPADAMLINRHISELREALGISPPSDRTQTPP